MRAAFAILAIALWLLFATTAAYAQDQDHFYLLPGIQSGKPMRGTVNLGIMFATKEEPPRGHAERCGFLAAVAEIIPGGITGSQSTDMRCGFLAEGSLGHGGARYSAGLWAIDRDSVVEGGGWGLDVRAVMNHTFAAPRGAAPNSNYIGGEAGLIIWRIFRISAGVEHRISGPDGPFGTIFTWSYGVQIPVQLFKIR
jgi:hypothetical protein